MKRTIQSVLMLVALWGALLTIALRKGWEMPRWLTSSSQDQGQAQPTRDATDDSHDDDDAHATNDESTAAAKPTANETPVVEDFARYRVCESDAPTLSRITLSDAGDDLAVHCGDSVAVIALSNQPERIMQLTLPARNPSESLKATQLVSADINADGLADLVIPWLTVDAWQHPIGRSMLTLLREPTGGFHAAPRPIATSPLQLIAGTLDAETGADIALLHATDESVRKPRELWWISGGPTPKKTGTSTLATHTEALALCDLDRDGHQDLIAVSAADARIDVVFGSGAGGADSAVQLQAAGCNELVVADLNGDAHNDVICAGDKSYVIEARADRSLTVQALSFAGERVRSLQAADLNADGKLDLVGYAHPQLVRLEQGSGFTFEPRMVAELQGTTFAPLVAQVADFDHDGQLDLVMLGRAPHDSKGVDLVLVDHVNDHVQITVSAEAKPLPNARLLLTPSLP